MSDNITGLWVDKTTKKYSFIQTADNIYQLIFSQKHGYLYEKNGGDKPTEQDEPVDFPSLVDDISGKPITRVQEGYVGGFSSFIGMEAGYNYRQCEVCFEYFMICDPVFGVHIDDCECGHMEINENGDWVTK
jgi:hypothetical protein